MFIPLWRELVIVRKEMFIPLWRELVDVREDMFIPLSWDDLSKNEMRGRSFGRKKCTVRLIFYRKGYASQPVLLNIGSRPIYVT